MMKLIKLHRMGPKWYAGIQDGNITIGGLFGAPTEFSSNMSFFDVLKEIKLRNPEIEIALKEVE